MTRTVTVRRQALRRDISILLLLLLLPAIAAAQTPSERVDSLDRWLAELKQAKRSSDEGTLQHWVRAQETLRDLAMIGSNPETDSATAWRSLYVSGYGFWLLELFDIAADYDREIVEGPVDTRQRVLALKDLAQSLENAGLFEQSANESERVLASSEQPGVLEINNHALRLLKAGRLDECLEYVRRIELSEEAAHTRIFSARAHAWQGRHTEAAAELRAACEHGETAACTMLDKLGEQKPEQYWSDDRAFRLRIWQPYNRIDSSIALATAPVLRGRGKSAVVSSFAPSYWFKQSSRLYPGSADGDFTPHYPPSLPPGRVGVVAISGVPFVSFVIDPEISDSAARAGVVRYLAEIRGDSITSPEMDLRTRAQMARLPAEEGGGTLVAITHAPWQEGWVRRLMPGAPWTVIEKP